MSGSGEEGEMLGVVSVWMLFESVAHLFRVCAKVIVVTSQLQFQVHTCFLKAARNAVDISRFVESVYSACVLIFCCHGSTNA